VRSLDGALDRTKADLQRSAAENATEAAMSSAAIDSFELEIWIEGGKITEPSKVKAPQRVKNWQRQTDSLHCYGQHSSDEKIEKACAQVLSSFQDIDKIKSLLAFLDPSDEGSVGLIFSLRSFTPTVAVAVDCNPVAAIEYPDKDNGHCVQISETFAMSQKPTHIKVLSDPFGRIGFRIVVEGQDHAGTGTAVPLTGKFGRDADLQEVIIGVSGNRSFSKIAPRMLMVTETLVLPDASRLTRDYKLRLSSMKGTDTLDDPLVAEYVRF
jgi:hypothetical protein